MIIAPPQARAARGKQEQRECRAGQVTREKSPELRRLWKDDTDGTVIRSLGIPVRCEKPRIDSVLFAVQIIVDDVRFDPL